MKLSHSSVTKFQTCPKSWELHYQRRYRPRLQSSALCFGTALDKSFEEMVHGRDARAMFEKIWSFQEINKVVTYLPDSELLSYYESDLDLYLLKDEDKEKLNAWLKENTPETRNWDVVFSEIEDLKASVGLKNLPEKRRRFHNLVFWHSLYRKGLLMLDALEKQVLPKLKIITTQEEIKLKLSDGGSVTGFVDLVAQYSAHEDDVVIFDLKTSSRPYEKDSVLTSPQLATYVHALKDKYKTRKAGYIVLLKQVIKNKTKKCAKCAQDGTGSKARTCDKEVAGERCKGEWLESFNPEIGIQIIVDTLPENLENLVIENMDYINSAINAGIFVRNLQSCEMPYGKCSFYKLCHEQSEEDVIKLEESNNA